MAARTTTRKKTTGRKKTTARKKPAAPKKTTPVKKTATPKKAAGSKKTAAPKKTARKYGAAAQESVREEMHEFERGTARSGPGGKGGKVKSRQQAIAVGLSEARAAGKKVPPNPNR